jgi:hypothetical protein
MHLLCVTLSLFQHKSYFRRFLISVRGRRNALPSITFSVGIFSWASLIQASIYRWSSPVVMVLRTISQTHGLIQKWEDRRENEEIKEGMGEDRNRERQKKIKERTEEEKIFYDGKTWFVALTEETSLQTLEPEAQESIFWLREMKWTRNGENYIIRNLNITRFSYGT